MFDTVSKHSPTDTVKPRRGHRHAEMVRSPQAGRATHALTRTTRTSALRQLVSHG
jgi:hypothetical protein